MKDTNGSAPAAAVNGSRYKYWLLNAVLSTGLLVIWYNWQLVDMPASIDKYKAVLIAMCITSAIGDLLAHILAKYKKVKMNSRILIRIVCSWLIYGVLMVTGYISSIIDNNPIFPATFCGPSIIGNLFVIKILVYFAADYIGLLSSMKLGRIFNG